MLPAVDAWAQHALQAEVAADVVRQPTAALPSRPYEASPSPLERKRAAVPAFHLPPGAVLPCHPLPLSQQLLTPKATIKIFNRSVSLYDSMRLFSLFIFYFHLSFIFSRCVGLRPAALC